MLSRFVLIFSLLIIFKDATCGNNVDLMTAVQQRDIASIIILLDEPAQISRTQYEEALNIVAQNGDVEIFELLAPYVSRKAHRQAYAVLINGTAHFEVLDF